MEGQSRRLLLKNAAKAAAIATAGVIMADKASAQTSGALEKRSPLPSAQVKEPPQPGSKPPLFSSVVAYGNLIFLAGVGAHFPGNDSGAYRACTG